jgi:hypothetical protein
MEWFEAGHPKGIHEMAAKSEILAISELTARR